MGLEEAGAALPGEAGESRAGSGMADGTLAGTERGASVGGGVCVGADSVETEAGGCATAARLDGVGDRKGHAWLALDGAGTRTGSG